jgi:hypothetical protein
MNVGIGELQADEDLQRVEVRGRFGHVEQSVRPEEGSASVNTEAIETDEARCAAETDGDQGKYRP